jgi:hypothetical protein
VRKSELLALLSDPDLDNVTVVIAQDAEGNSFSVIDEVSWEDEEESDLYDTFGTPVIVLWPV